VIVLSVVLISFLVYYLDLDFLTIYRRYSFFEDATGSGRTILWSYLLNSMTDPLAIIFGNGAGSLNIIIPITEDGLWWNEFVSTHNTYLEFFYQFGLIGLSAFLIFLYYTKKQIDKIELWENKIILKSLFYVTLINMCFDSYFFAIQITAIFSLFFSLFWEGKNAR